MFLKVIAGVLPSAFRVTSSSDLGLTELRKLFTLNVDSRPWWHSMHRLASTGFKTPLSSFSVLKVSCAPDGNGTSCEAPTERRAGKLAMSWQVEQAKPLAGSVGPTP